jgi:hypothetical protein
MQEYTRAVGGKINYDKTDGILFGFQDGLMFPGNIVWKSPSHPLKYLGIIFGPQSDNKWTSLVEDIKSKISVWSNFHLSDVGKVRLWNQVMLSTLIYNMKGTLLNPQRLKELEDICRNFITTNNQKYKIKTLSKPPTEGGLGLITPGSAWTSLTMRWWTDMLTHPKGFWQRGMWHLIHRICPNFKAQLCESRIPSPPPNTPEPLLAR